MKICFFYKIQDGAASTCVHQPCQLSEGAFGQRSAGPPFGGKQHQTTDEEKENWREGDRFGSSRGRKVGADTELIRLGWTEGGNKKNTMLGDGIEGGISGRGSGKR